MKIVIGVACKSERRQTVLFYCDAKFLMQFTNKSLFRTFACLDFAARKFPEPRHAFAFRAFSNQNAAIRINKRTGNNEQKFHNKESRSEALPRAHSSESPRRSKEKRANWTRVYRQDRKSTRLNYSH